VSYSFKSSGKTVTTTNDEKLSETTVPVGFATPLSLGTTALFKMNYTLAAQVHDNLKNLLLTNFGERLCQYNFGANLKELVSEYTSQDDFDTEAINRIKTAVSSWMPYVDLENFSSDVDRFNNTNTAIITITITYNVPSLNVFGKKLEINLYAM
jgi:phage baseplate assembly protein W